MKPPPETPGPTAARPGPALSMDGCGTGGYTRRSPRAAPCAGKTSRVLEQAEGRGRPPAKHQPVSCQQYS